MLPFLSYELRSAISIAFFWCLFSLLLRREPTHRSNRGCLLGSIVLSLVIPLFSITIHRQVVLLPRLDPPTSTSPVELTHRWSAILEGFLCVGMTMILGARLFSWWTAFRIVRRGSRIKLLDGVSCIVVSGRINPFVWFRTVVLSREDFEEANGVLAHELAHIYLKHHWDLLLLDLFVILQWFNPFAWLIRRDLRRIHEYEADAKAVSQVSDKKSYCLLLLKRAVGNDRFVKMTQFEGGSVRRRIAMLDSVPPRGVPAKAFLMLSGVLMVIACSIHLKIDYSAGYAVMDPVAIVNLTHGGQWKPLDTSVLEDLAPSVSFGGELPEMLSDMRFQKWVAMNVSPPKTNETGIVLASFRIAKTGKMEDLSILKGASGSLNQAVLEALSEMPEWAPATISGKPTDFVLVLPVTFQ